MIAPYDTVITWDETLSLIRKESAVWIRLVAVDTEDGWQVRLLELTSGEPPPNWESRAWRYPKAWFVASVVSGPDVADWLTSEKLVLEDREVAMPSSAGHNQIRWERRASGSPGRFETLPWPSTEASLPSQMQNQPEPQGHLLAPLLPSFVTFYTAAVNFFGFDSQQPMGGSIQPCVTYRHQDISGRINSVRIADDGIDIEVEGSAITGMVIELAGDLPGPTHSIWDRFNRVDSAHFDLEGGLPSGAWALLKNDEYWVDRRFLSHPFQHGADPGVEYVVDPGTRLEVFLAAAERHGVEFKSKVPTQDDSKLRVMKTVAAFANGEGGSVLFGIDDDRQFVGLAAGGIDRVKDQISNLVRSWVIPMPPIDFDVLPYEENEDLVVLELIVDADDQLHGAGRPAEISTVYVRPYGTTEKASPNEIARIVQAKMAGKLLPLTGPFQ